MKPPSKSCINKIQNILTDWGKAHFVEFPWRITDNKFHGLVAEILLQRTRAEQVVPVFETFVQLFPNIETASRGGDQIKEILKPLGLKWRAEKLLELINELSLRKTIPESKVDLLELPGVGPYAASAFLSFHAGQRALIIDSNAVRVWSRVFGFVANGETRRKQWFIGIVNRITPETNSKDFNYAVLDHTRIICRPKPRCQICPIHCLCRYYKRVYFKTKISQ